MMRSRFFLFALLVASISPFNAYADLKMASWNMTRLGEGHIKEYRALGAVSGKFDFIAIQEVMTLKALNKVEKQVEELTKESWSTLSSGATGRGSYKEIYTFMYRDSAITYIGGAVSYIDPGDGFTREPFSARFRINSTGQEFAAANIHMIYGSKVSQRVKEAQRLDEYWIWLHDTYGETTAVFLMGDFNLNPSHASFAHLRVNAKPLITKGKSTLTNKDGVFANLYDNIWVSNNIEFNAASAAVLNYPKMLGWRHFDARKRVADHAPVYLRFDRFNTSKITLDRSVLSLANDAGTQYDPVPGATPPKKLSMKDKAENHISDLKKKKDDFYKLRDKLKL